MNMKSTKDVQTAERTGSRKWIWRFVALGVFVLVLAGVWLVSSRSRAPIAEGDAVSLLRQQLADESVTEVTIDGELAVSEALVVRGEKTITGDGTITVLDDVSLPGGLLRLENGAALTVASGYIDSRSRANGIYVPESARLTVSGGEILNASEWNVWNDGETDITGGTIYYAAANNIYTKGRLNISGGTVSDSGRNNIYQASGSALTMTGGTLADGGADNLYAEAGAVTRIDGEKARINSAILYGIETDGQLTIDYVNMSKNMTAHILVGDTGTLTLNDGYFSASSGYGIRNQGTMVMTGGEISSNALSGIENRGELSITAGTITFNTERAVTNKIGGTLQISGRDVTLSGSSYGLYNEENAQATLKNVTIQNNKTSNIRNFGTVYVSDADLLDCGSNSVSNYRNGYLSLENVNIERTSTNHGVYNDRGEVVFKNLTVKDVSSRAIQNKGGVVTGSNLSADGCGGAVIGNNLPNDKSQGRMTINGFTTANPQSNNIYCENGSICISNATLAVSPKNSVRVVDGNVTLSGVYIAGTAKPGENASCDVYTSGGKTVLRSVTLNNSASPALNNRGGAVEMYDVTITNAQATAIYNRPEAGSGAVGNIYGERVTVSGSATANVNNEAAGTTIKLVDSTLNATPLTNVIATNGTVELENTAVLGTNGDGQKPGFFISSDAAGVIRGSTRIAGAYGKGVNNEGTFYMYGGTIENNRANAGAGLTNSGKAYLSGGKITGNESLTASGGGIINNTGAELYLQGVEISGNTAYSIGGGMALTDGSLCVMTGGAVSDNHAGGNGSSAGGGGANVAGGAQFYFLGGSFSGNTISAAEAGTVPVGSAIRSSSPTSELYMGGDASVAPDNEIYIHDQSVIHITEALTTEKPINLTIRNYSYGQAVLREDEEGGGLLAAAAEKFSLPSPWYIDSQGNLGNSNVIGSDEYVARIYDADKGAYEYYGTLNEAVAAVPDGAAAAIELISDIQQPGLVTIDGGKQITLTDDGEIRTISRHPEYTNGRLICVTGNAGLTLASTGTDSEPKLIFDGGVEAANGQFIIVGTGTADSTVNALTINSGVVLKNNVSTSTAGGAIAVYAGGMTMEGGLIDGNRAAASSGGAVNVAGSCTFTMNGGTISNNEANTASGAVNVSANGSFVMNGGKITGNTATTLGGGVGVTGTFTMTGGTISDNTAGTYGGGVNLAKGGSFHMSGGEITGNIAQTQRGGGVNLAGSSKEFVMTGGSISGNTAKTLGGGVCLQDNATMTVTGGTISGNSAGSGGNGIDLHYSNNTLTLGGTPVIDEIYFYDYNDLAGAEIRLNTGFASEAPIGLAFRLPSEGHKVLASGLTYTQEQLGCFVVNAFGYRLNSAGVLESMGDYAAVDDKNNGYPDLQSAIDAVPANGASTITLTADITGLSGSNPIKISDGRNITLTVPEDVSHTITRGSSSGRLIQILGGASLTLQGNGGGILTLDGENKSTSNGQLVMVGNTSGESGALVINDGVVLQNANITGTGAALAVYNGTATMNGGRISGNETTSAAGGAMNVNATTGSFIMNGGEISNNTASTNGGAINLGGTMVINGGTISANTASGGKGGGAIYLSGASSSLTVSGGEITGNTAINGGAIYVANAKGQLSLTGGTLSRNAASASGGAVFLNGAAMTLSGSSVEGNSAGEYGGGVHLTGSGASLVMTDGSITGNSTAKYRGGGVNAGGNTSFTMSGGTISGNTAQTQGGGVCVQNNAAMTMTGGTITGNTAVSGGSGIDLHGAGSTLALGGALKLQEIYFFAASTAGITLDEGFSADPAISLKFNAGVAQEGLRVLAVGEYSTQLGYFAVEEDGLTLGTDGTLKALDADSALDEDENTDNAALENNGQEDLAEPTDTLTPDSPAAEGGESGQEERGPEEHLKTEDGGEESEE